MEKREETNETVRVSDVACALAEYWDLLDEIPSPNVQVNVVGSERDVSLSIVAPDIGFRWSVTVPRAMSSQLPKYVAIMKAISSSLRSQLQHAFPHRPTCHAGAFTGAVEDSGGHRQAGPDQPCGG